MFTFRRSTPPAEQFRGPNDFRPRSWHARENCGFRIETPLYQVSWSLETPSGMSTSFREEIRHAGNNHLSNCRPSQVHEHPRITKSTRDLRQDHLDPISGPIHIESYVRIGASVWKAARFEMALNWIAPYIYRCSCYCFNHIISTPRPTSHHSLLSQNDSISDLIRLFIAIRNDPFRCLYLPPPS